MHKFNIKKLRHLYIHAHKLKAKHILFVLNRNNTFNCCKHKICLIKKEQDMRYMNNNNILNQIITMTFSQTDSSALWEVLSRPSDGLIWSGNTSMVYWNRYVVLLYLKFLHSCNILEDFQIFFSLRTWVYFQITLLYNLLRCVVPTLKSAD